MLQDKEMKKITVLCLLVVILPFVFMAYQYFDHSQVNTKIAKEIESRGPDARARLGDGSDSTIRFAGLCKLIAERKIGPKSAENQKGYKAEFYFTGLGWELHSMITPSWKLSQPSE